MKIIVLDSDPERREALAATISENLPPGAALHLHPPHTVFEEALPRDFFAAFIAVDGAAELEAVRQYRRLYPNVPVVFVCETEQFAMRAHAHGALDYLMRPMVRENIREALRRCEMKYQDEWAMNMYTRRN